MQPSYHFTDWFLHNWSRAALPAGIVLVLLAPVIYKLGGLPLLLIYMQLAIYMIHQYEEHAEGKFKAATNRLLAGGQEKITDVQIFWINIGGVWGVYVLVINLATFGAIGFGLMAIYTTLANGILHIVLAVIERKYNPGVLTSIILFLPVSSYALYTVSQTADVTMAYHLLGIATAIVVHAITFGYLNIVARR